MVFTPVADTYVSKSEPSRNFGEDSVLHVDGQPVVRSYLRFTLQGVDRRQVKQVLLQVFATKSDQGFSVQWVKDKNWSETSLTYANAPRPGGILARIQNIKQDGWVTLDLTRYVRWNGSYTFALTTTSSNEILIGSSEAGDFSPQLVIVSRK